MAHIPNNSGCRNTWARVFAAIVDRFSYTIRGIFNGHTHNDSYGLFYDHKTGEPVNANFISRIITIFLNKSIILIHKFLNSFFDHFFLVVTFF